MFAVSINTRIDITGLFLNAYSPLGYRPKYAFCAEFSSVNGLPNKSQLRLVVYRIRLFGVMENQQ